MCFCWDWFFRFYFIHLFLFFSYELLRFIPNVIYLQLIPFGIYIEFEHSKIFLLFLQILIYTFTSAVRSCFSLIASKGNFLQLLHLFLFCYLVLPWDHFKTTFYFKKTVFHPLMDSNMKKKNSFLFRNFACGFTVINLQYAFILLWTNNEWFTTLQTFSFIFLHFFLNIKFCSLEHWHISQLEIYATYLRWS